MSLFGGQNRDPNPTPQPYHCFSSRGAFNVEQVFDVVVSAEKLAKVIEQSCCPAGISLTHLEDFKTKFLRFSS